jgi:hypothetical protein
MRQDQSTGVAKDIVVPVTRRWGAALPLVAFVALVLTEVAFVGPASSAVAPTPTSYRNPVHGGDFADPFVVSTPTGWVAYATQHGLANIQIATSPDLVTWTDVGTALPFLPPWADGYAVWAPAVLPRGDHAVLYYAVLERASGRVCVSAAVAAGPTGPFVDQSKGPLVCQRDLGGTIDPSPFVDADGRAYLLFKSEGVADAEPTRLWAQPLRADGLALDSDPVELLHTEQPWEDPIVEAPSMTRDPDGQYHLLYSGGRWQSADYAVGWATCDSPLGPCRRASTTPVLQSSDDVAGPGGAEFFSGPEGETWIAFHAWIGPVGYPQGRRSMLIERVGFAGGRIFLDQPTTAAVRFDHDPVPPPPPVDTSPLASGHAPQTAAPLDAPESPGVAITADTRSTMPAPAAPASITGRGFDAPTTTPPGGSGVGRSRHHATALFPALIACVTIIVTAAACITTMIDRRRSGRALARLTW